MLQTLHIQTTLQQDGELHLSDLPFRRGQSLEISIQVEEPASFSPTLTAQHLLTSGLIGLWKNRTDIDDSVSYARALRQHAQRRGHE